MPANAALVAGTKAFSVTFKTGGSRTLTATDITNGAKTPNTSPSITVGAGAFTKLQLLVPGETAAPGTATGKTGTPTTQTAGTAFNVTVNAVDANWNVANTATDTVGITSTDANAALPANTPLVAGTQTLSVTLKTVGSRTLTATDITNGAETPNTSPSITVSVGTFSKLQVLAPGEAAAPGSATGKTGVPTVQTAGTAFNVTVNAVDANWNLVNTNDTVRITSSDANATLPANAALVAGTKTFSVTFKTAGSRTVTATDVTNGAITANTSSAITANPGAFTKLQLLVPGESAAPGTATGKTGTPTTQIAGTALTVTVNAVDANWNLVNTNDTVGITSTDANAALPANAALVSGLQTFSLTLKTLGSRTITATDVTNGLKTPNTSPAITVNVGAFAKLQVLATGEAAAPGTANGKTGTPTAQTAGTAFNVTVNAVDANWNLVSTNDTVGITSNDANATLPANAALVGGTKTFSVTPKTAGGRTVTAADITNGAITANTSSAITINAGAFTKLQLLVPGETAAPGTAAGKTGTPSAQPAGTPFTVTVNAVDANWNVASATDMVGITSNDPNAALPANTALVAGTQNLSVTLKTVGGRTITATDITNGAKSPNTSPTITVAAGTFAQLQVLAPGETAAPGTASGKTGAPTAQTAAAAFTITVNAVDSVWNVVSVSDTVGITSTDPNAGLPANAALVGGTKTFSVTFKTAGSRTVTAADITNGAITANTSSAITANPGAFTKLQVLVPGETAAPGTAAGKTGTPSGQAAGTAFNVTVNAVDANWNVAPATDTVGITSTDSNASMPGNAALVFGTQTFSVTFKTAGNRTLTATDITNGAKAPNSSPAIAVGAGAFSKLQLLVPGETAAPGTATGKTGAPSSRTAGAAFTVTVNAVDANWNVASASDAVGMTSTDANAALPANTALAGGTQTFSVTLNTPGNQTIAATDITNGIVTANTSPAITVSAGPFAKLQLLLPGETAAPGTTTGKAGAPSAQIAGTPFNVTVNAVDAAWNVVSANDTVAITSSDANASLPANGTLVAGTKTFSITFKTAGSRTVTATDLTNGAMTPNTNSAVVNPGAFTKLQILVPGETAAPGTVTGKSGTPSTQWARLEFDVIVNAVDANWNPVHSITDTVHLTAAGEPATLPGDAALAAGTGSFSVTFDDSGTGSVEPSDVTDPAKTPDTSSLIAVNPPVLTAATGGGAISADSVANTAWTSLTGPIYTEPSVGAVTIGAITINAPPGFEFDTGTPSPVVKVEGDPAPGLNINQTTTDGTIAAVTTSSSITINITNSSSGGTPNTLTWQNLRVRPTAGTPLAAGPITKSGDATLVGVTDGASSFGDLAEVAGIAAQLLFLTAPQTMTAGAPSDVVTVQRQDQFGNPNTNDASLSVVLDSNSSGPSEFRDVAQTTVLSAVSIPNGESSASFLYYDERAGTPTVTAAATDLITTVQSETVNPAPADHLAVGLQPSAVATAGSAFAQQPSVRIEDAFNNLIATDNTTSINATSVGSSGTLQGSTTVVANGGIAHFNDLSYNVAESIRLRFTSPPLGSATSAVITVGASDPASFAAVSGDAQSGAVAASLSFPFVVQVLDVYGNPVPGASVGFTISSSPATAAGQKLSSDNALTGNDGRAQTILTLGTKTGRYTVTAVAAALPGSPATFGATATSGAAVKLAFQIQPGSAVAGSPFGQQPVVSTLDAYDNASAMGLPTGALVSLSLVSGAGPLLGTTTLDLGAASSNPGLATFTDLRLDKAGSAQLEATFASLTSSRSSVFSVNATGAAIVSVETAADGTGAVVAAQTLTSGTSVTNYAVARDEFGNFVANVGADHWTLVSVTGSVANSDLAPAGDGQSAVFTSNCSGTAQIQATKSGLTSIDSGLFTTVDDVPPTITPPADLTAVPTDPGQSYASGVALGEPTTGDNCTVASVSNNAPAHFPLGTTWVTWTVTDSASNRITATQSVTVQDGEPPTIQFCPPNRNVPADRFAGGSIPDLRSELTVTDNVTSANDLVVTQDPAPGTVVGLGTTSVILTVRDLANNSANCTSQVTIIPGPANTLAFATQPGSVIVGLPFGTSPAVKTQDAFGNDSGNGLPASLIVILTLQTGPGNLSGTTSLDAGTASGNGLVVFGGLVLDSTSSADVLLASANGFSAAVSDPFPVINHPPVTTDDSLDRPPDKPIKVTVAKLLANDSDPDGHSLSIVSVSPVTPNGATVILDGAWVLYTPPPGFNGTDTFTYTASDGFGGLTPATVTVTVLSPDDAPSQNVLTITQDGPDVVIQFVGIPGRTYQIQFTTDMNNPNWTTMGSATAGANGLFEFRDVAPPGPTRFYRTFRP
jgi:anti-sigma factor ChrR (cupin superfamily)